MMLRAGRKRARDVSLYDTIGTDKDGETVSLMDVLEADEIQALDTIIMEQDVKELYQAYETCLKACSDPESIPRERWRPFWEFHVPM